MGGGLLQLVAYGAQDVYLTGNPQITFFKVVYRRHTNFALEAIEQTFNGNPGFGSRVTCQISRNGDLIHKAYLVVSLPATSAVYCNFIGLRLINYIEVEIGGQRIDRHYANWMYVWNELTLPISKRAGFNDMVGAYGGAVNGNATYTINSVTFQRNVLNPVLYIPLEFWFCRNIGLALPLIALQYHEVKFNLLFETAANCCAPGTVSTLSSFNASIWVDYIYLDTDERRRFAQLSHEYLIEQLQFTGQEAITSTSIKPKLNFNHPVKELIFFVVNTSNTGSGVQDNNNWFNFTTRINAIQQTATFTTYESINNALKTSPITSTGTASIYNYSTNPISNAKLVLNGNDRFAVRNGSYFNIIQNFQHHDNIPSNSGINVYSFGLKPEEHQPSGTLNMSRIDTAVLNLTLTTIPSTLTLPTAISTVSTSETAVPLITSASSVYSTTNASLYVYATNYNVLRILSGMGGLAYSN